MKYICSRLAPLKLVCAREDGMCVRCISNKKIINTVLQPGGGVELLWSDGWSSWRVLVKRLLIGAARVPE